MTTKSELLKNVRIFCRDCCGGPRSGRKVWPVPNPSEIERCETRDCMCFEFRHGIDPRPSESRVEAGRRSALLTEP